MLKNRKVVVVGDGAVGSTVSYTLILGPAASEVVIIDVNKEKAEGDCLDMADGMSFLSSPKKVYSGGYEECEDAKVIVITAGANQKVGETRQDLLKKNAAIMASICEQIKPHLNPESIVLVVTNPCDVLTYLVQKNLGLPYNQVFGSGTVLDTSRLKTAISKDTKVDPRNIHTFVLGEHGDTEVACWSATNVGGMSLIDYCAKCGACKGKQMARLDQLHETVKNAAYRIIEKKGATNYAVALAVSRIVKCILNDENSVLTVSCYLHEEFGGALDDVYLSLPCIVNSKGVDRILRLNYTTMEQMALLDSGRILKEKIKEALAPAE